jgi:hypothetical protein
MEIRRRSVVVERRGHPEFAGGARLLLLLRHRGIESGDVYADPALAADVGRQIEREAKGIVQLEGGGTVENTVAGHRREFALEDAHAVLYGLEEADLFLPQHLGHARLVAGQFGIRSTHFGTRSGTMRWKKAVRAPSL